jgi:hypothetical protein
MDMTAARCPQSFTILAVCHEDPGLLHTCLFLPCVQYVEDAVIMRGLEANRLVVYRRVMDRWRQYTQESRKYKALTHSLQALAMLRALQEWRYHLKASDVVEWFLWWQQPLRQPCYCDPLQSCMLHSCASKH